MKISYAKINKCRSFGIWLYHETRDFLRVFGIEFNWRVFRVIYPDGTKSILMSKYQAYNYANIFGGTVEKQ